MSNSLCVTYYSLLACMLLLCSLHVASVSAQVSNNTTKRWQTLTGNPPLVIARGGFSGLFPDSSSTAYEFALATSVRNVILWCDVQLTKDAAGICFQDINLNNASDSAVVFPSKQKTYIVNGAHVKGSFSVDFTLAELANVTLNQATYYRTNKFDGNMYPILTPQDVVNQFKPPGFWLNIQHDAFYKQHNLSMGSFVLSVSRDVDINYISSPEVTFLNNISAQFKASPAKLIFRFLGQNFLEPSTNLTYGSLLKNLTYIRTFASGILVPKDYIWPIDQDNYLQSHTSLVLDAHKEGLEVFASDFANDVPLSYSYSYDPTAEYLRFIDNGQFSVDGVLSDFPITPSAAQHCFAHLGNNASVQVKPLIISKNGASGDYPGCTDLAYRKAISDGVDILDCPVQMSQDGIPFCLGSIDLIDGTSVAKSNFSNLASRIPEIKKASGIYAFNLSWSQIQSLSPQISSPYSANHLQRNPRYQNDGKFVALSDFLALAKNTSSLTGVLISIKNAAYLAGKPRLDVVDAVLDALGKSGYDQQTDQRVMIQSPDSAVLMKFNKSSKYELVYKIEETISEIQNATIEEIKGISKAVVIVKDSVFPKNEKFSSGYTNVVSKLQSYNLSVYVEIFSNEFTSQAWDFLSDPTVELNSYVTVANIDGVITDFPKTAARYKRNRCLNMGSNIPSYMSPIKPGSLFQVIGSPLYKPPAEAPRPVLSPSDVAEPPLPAVEKNPANDVGHEPAAVPTSPNSQPRITVCMSLSILAMLAAMKSFHF